MKPKLASIALILLIQMIAGCSQKNRHVTVSDPQAALKTTVADFKRQEKPKIYDKENLWKSVDGAAESYLSYGFEKAASADYAMEQNEVNIQIFSFDSTLGAFGIYAENRTPNENFINLGAEGFISPGYLTFYNGIYFVRISAFNQNIDMNLLGSLGAAINKELNAPVKSTISFKFPKGGYVSHSERYIPSGFLDSPDLLNVFTAEGQIDTIAFTLFYFQDVSGFQKLKNWITEHSNSIEVAQNPYKVLIKTDSAQKTIVAAQKGKFCFGLISLGNFPAQDSAFNAYSAREF